MSCRQSILATARPGTMRGRDGRSIGKSPIVAQQRAGQRDTHPPAGDNIHPTNSSRSPRQTGAWKSPENTSAYNFPHAYEFDMALWARRSCSGNVGSRLVAGRVRRHLASPISRVRAVRHQTGVVRDRIIGNEDTRVWSPRSANHILPTPAVIVLEASLPPPRTEPSHKHKHIIINHLQQNLSQSRNRLQFSRDALLAQVRAN